MTRLGEALRRAAESEDANLFPDNPGKGLASPPSAAWEIPADETVAVMPGPGPRVPTLAPLSVLPPPVQSPVAAEPSAPPPLVSRFADNERDKMVVGKNADPSVVEQYRHLAAALHKAQGELGYRSVMVTSALAAEGKTLTAANLALTLSHSYQRRVLLIDADLRRPRLQDLFGLTAGPGLTDSLALPRGGKLPLHHLSDTLWVLGAGRPIDDPMSTLVSPSMQHLLGDAKDVFDWVIVDTPPIAILPDANLLAAMIDTALLVVSAPTTPYPMVQRAAQAIGTTRILGVVLNRAEKAGLSAGYGYYDDYPAAGGRPGPQGRWTGWFRKARGAPDVQ